MALSKNIKQLEAKVLSGEIDGDSDLFDMHADGEITSEDFTHLRGKWNVHKEKAQMVKDAEWKGNIEARITAIEKKRDDRITDLENRLAHCAEGLESLKSMLETFLGSDK